MLRVSRLACDFAGDRRLVLTGGVAMNCSANGVLLRSGEFDDLHVVPMPYDAGVSLGAALYVDSQLRQEWQPPTKRMRDCYLAPTNPRNETEKAVSKSNFKFEQLTDSDLIDYTAQAVADGRVVGWWSGRAEVGQRALGARSILADPRNRSNLVRLNQIKGREIWRPFAPSVLEEYANELFDGKLSNLSDFMLAAAIVKPSERWRIPAVVHVDGTARPQIVRRESNPKYWSLINAFRQITGVPAVLNTSFNLAGEPIVYTAQDAISTFERSELDVLVVDEFIAFR